MRRVQRLALLVLLAAPVALARDPVVDVGVQLYQHGDYPGAALAMKNVLNRGLRDPTDRATAALTLAASEAALGDEQMSRSVLIGLFSDQPTAAIDPNLFPPDFIRFANQVRQEVTGAGAAQPRSFAGPPQQPQPGPPAGPPPEQGPPAPAPAPSAPPPSWARWPGPHGFQFGVRTALAIPFGDEVRGLKLADDISSALPFELDLGWRIDPRWYIGAWFAGGPAFVNGSCPEACSADVASGGVEGELHFNPFGIDPWVGLGLGYESLHTQFVSGGFFYDNTLGGMMFTRIDAGADFRFSPFFTLGPYVGWSVGEFFHVSGPGYGASIGEKGVHAFFDLGARATMNFE